MKISIPIFCFLIQAISSFSQSNTCGTDIDGQELSQLWSVNHTASTRSSTSEIQYFRVQHHIIRRSDGSGGLSANIPDQLLVFLNEKYLEAKIQFFSCGDINFINDDILYTWEYYNSPNTATLKANYNVSNALNIYYTDSITNGVNAFAYYPTNSNSDNIVVIQNNVSWPGNPSIIHEFGHTFGLSHTFNNSGTSQAELVTRGPNANCSTHGDRLCDTPADPYIGASSGRVDQGTCQYIGTVADANGEQFNPNTRLYMSYSHYNCMSEFSEEQLDEMYYWANSSYRQPQAASVINSVNSGSDGYINISEIGLNGQVFDNKGAVISVLNIVNSVFRIQAPVQIGYSGGENMLNIENTGKLILESGGALTNCANCNASITYNVFGELDIQGSSFFELTRNSIIHIKDGGLVNITGVDFCFDPANITIDGSGSLHINGVDYSDVIMYYNTHKLVTNSVEHNVYAKNSITTSGNVELNFGYSYKAGESITLTSGFSAGPGFEAVLDDNINYCYNNVACDPNSQGRSTEKNGEQNRETEITNEILLSQNNLSVYPNPTNNLVTIEIPEVEESTIVTIINFSGQTILSEKITEQKTVVDLSTFSNGLYIFNVVSNSTNEVVKILKN